MSRGCQEASELQRGAESTSEKHPLADINQINLSDTPLNLSDKRG